MVGRRRQSPDGAALAWNLVSGVNDPPSGSERAVWIDGEPREAQPVALQRRPAAHRLQPTARSCASTPRPSAPQREPVIFKSDYRAPFGTFSGALPGGVALAHGLGVVEHHRALW